MSTFLTSKIFKGLFTQFCYVQRQQMVSMFLLKNHPKPLKDPTIGCQTGIFQVNWDDVDDSESKLCHGHFRRAISGIHAMTHKPCVELLEVFITPPKFHMELKMMVWKMIFLFQGCILRFHVRLHRVKCFKESPPPKKWQIWIVLLTPSSGPRINIPLTWQRRCSWRKLKGNRSGYLDMLWRGGKGATTKNTPGGYNSKTQQLEAACHASSKRDVTFLLRHVHPILELPLVRFLGFKYSSLRVDVIVSCLDILFSAVFDCSLNRTTQPFRSPELSRLHIRARKQKWRTAGHVLWRWSSWTKIATLGDGNPYLKLLRTRIFQVFRF